jgi:hypothetical protein
MSLFFPVCTVLYSGPGGAERACGGRVLLEDRPSFWSGGRGGFKVCRPVEDRQDKAARVLEINDVMKHWDGKR